MPFAAGPRMCIGMTLALMEARILFALALRELDIVRSQRGGAALAKSAVQVTLAAMQRKRMIAL